MINILKLLTHLFVYPIFWVKLFTCTRTSFMWPEIIFELWLLMLYLSVEMYTNTIDCALLRGGLKSMLTFLFHENAYNYIVLANFNRDPP